MSSNFLRDLEKQLEPFRAKQRTTLPTLPTDPIQWIKEARPLVEGRPRSFLVAPFWEHIYQDPQNNKFIIGGRQIFKSTYTTDILAQEATSQQNVQVCYVTFDDINKSGFSRQKLQIGTFEGNPILAQFPRFGRGNVGEISLKNGSTIYITTDHNQYKHVEGKSLSHVMLDEAQYQDIQHFERVVMTMMQTHGKITVCGIGGEAGSPYEELWRRTDQREWIYDDPKWRDRLKFGVVDGKQQLLVGDYLKEILKGHWDVTSPATSHWHGYHLPQEIFPTIPLTMDSAINQYGIDPQFSIEYQRKHSSSSMYASHVVGEFYKAQRRPITVEMVEQCMKPYRYLKLLKPYEIAQIKEQYGNKVKVSMGVDFGSGNPSQTVISIMIKWIITPTEENRNVSDRYQLAFIDVRPAENQLDQAELINKIFKDANCDIGVGDLGYGAIQVKLIQDGGANRTTGKLFDGVSSSKFYGSRSIGDDTKPLLEFAKKVDEHGEVRESIRLDKTNSIQEFVDFLDEVSLHPVTPLNENTQRPKFMIPFHPDHEEDVEFLIHDLTSLTRKDLDKMEKGDGTDPRQKARKEFNHPKDSLMSLIYALQAQKIKQYWNYVSI
jgi:hypothetical protein|tara:strand:- start:27 stop:1841 length:1815 start_codon:yes stop_codon:yes gene_type:complete